MMFSRILAAFSAAALLSSPAAFAQESSYTYGTVWEFSYIQTEPGQFEKYLDWLSGDWRKIMELQKKEGVVVSYHILQVMCRRHSGSNCRRRSRRCCGPTPTRRTRRRANANRCGNSRGAWNCRNSN